MITQLILTRKEAELLQELLESDRRRMLPEIRRTDGHAMRDELNRRLRTVDRLIERLHHPEDEPEAAEVTAGAARRQPQSPPAGNVDASI
jgi:hypothetical protein